MNQNHVCLSRGKVIEIISEEIILVQCLECQKKALAYNQIEGISYIVTKKEYKSIINE